MRLRVPLRAALVLLAVCVFVFVSAAIPATKKPPSHPIDINSASAKQLQEVPGIGPATAEKILRMRKSYGAFKSVDDLLSVRGIGPKRLEKMRKYLVAGHAPQRKGSGARASPAAADPAVCASCSRAAPVKKTAVGSAMNSRPVSKPSEATESADEEPE